MPIIQKRTMFKTPFSAAYWRCAAEDFRSLRSLVFAALMIAACIVLSKFSIPIYAGLKISFGFLARALCALVCGPVTALVFGAAEDTLSFFLSSSGDPYFPGYMLTTMLGTFIYALFLYRTRVTVLRIFLAKLCTNVMNVFLGSLWSAILYGKGYLYYMTNSMIKNTLMLPVQTLMLVVLFGALVPVLYRMGALPNQAERRLALIGDSRKRCEAPFSRELHEMFPSISDEIVGKYFMRSVISEAHVPGNDRFSSDSVICG